MKRIVACLFCTFICMTCVAQNISVAIKGVVKDSTTTEGLIGVHILSDSLGLGVTTDRYGRFIIVLPKGAHRLNISYLGYQEKLVDISASVDTSLILYLAPEILELGSIEVSDGRTSVPATSASIAILKPEEVKQLPMLGGEADVIKALQLMPGVNGGREGAAGLHVRGGGTDQNLVLVDGTPIYNINHMIGFLSAFNPDVIRSVSLTKGPGPARYGGRLSSVVDISLKEGDLRKQRIHGNIGIVGAMGTIEGPIKKGKMSYLLSVRRTYLDLFFLAFQPPKEKFGYYFTDLVGKISSVSDKHGLYLSIYAGEDRFWTRSREETTNTSEQYKGSLKWGNLTGSLRWQGQLASNVLATAALSRTAYGLRFFEETKEERLTTGTTFGDEIFFTSGITDWALRSDISLFLRKGTTLRVGGVFVLHQFTPGSRTARFEENGEQRDDLGSEQIQQLEAASASLYTEAEILLLPKLEIVGGFRLSQFHVRSKTYTMPEPRFSLRYQLNTSSTLEAAVSKATQTVHLLSRSGIGIPLDLWLPATSKIRPQEAWQYTVGGTHFLNKSEIQLSLDLYYKQMRHVIMPIAGSSLAGVDATNWEDRVEIGDGLAYGLEILARKRKGRFTGWLGYTLARSDRTFNNIDAGRSFPYRFDRRHDISITAAYQRTKEKSFSLTWVYASGNALWLPSRRIPAVEDFPGGYVWHQGDYSPDPEAYAYGAQNSSREPAYHRLDIAFQKTKPIRNGKGMGTFTLALYNVYFKRNPFFLTPKVQEDGRVVYEQFSPFIFIPGISYDFTF